MDVYQKNLGGLLGLCAALFIAQRSLSSASSTDKAQTAEKPANGKSAVHGPKSPAAVQASQRAFLVVYALVMGADWLQGPYLYSLYTDEHKVPASTVSALFTTGFLSGALSGSFVGALADRHGRKAVCMLFCLLCSASCLLTAAAGPSLPSLFLGRALGGLSTSILFSVFETWMVADGHWRGVEDLSGVFGRMGAVNGLVAIASGVGSEWLVEAAGTRKAPFGASVVLLMGALWVIMVRFRENYGEAAESSSSSTEDKAKENNTKPNSNTKLKQVLTDPRILTLGLAATVFEGSMYLFVFHWTPALNAARSSSTTTDLQQPLPYGIIFASFMAATLAASMAFGLAAGAVRYTTLLLLLLLTSHLVFLLLSAAGDGAGLTEQRTFWAFCLFEACVGVYWPCMGYLKGRLIEDAVRGQVYGLMRIPLNLFVVVALGVSGGGAAHGTVFGVCSGLLLGACGGLAAMMMLRRDGLP